MGQNGLPFARWKQIALGIPGALVNLIGEAADTLGIRRGTNPQAIRLYGTYTDASNYERLQFVTNAGAGTTIQQAHAGTGTGRDLLIYSGSRYLYLGQFNVGNTLLLDSLNKWLSLNEYNYGSSVVLGQSSEEVTIAAAASTDSAVNLLPAGSQILAVTCRVTVVIPTAATFSLGDATTPSRFKTGIAVAAGTTAIGLDHVGHTTAAASPKQDAAAKIRITPNATPGAATGKVRLTVWYQQFTAPTS